MCVGGVGGSARGLQARKSGDEKKQTQARDPEESLFPTPGGVQAALISTHKPPFKAPGRSKLPALGPSAQPEGTPLCVPVKGHLRNKAEHLHAAQNNGCEGNPVISALKLAGDSLLPAGRGGRWTPGEIPWAVGRRVARGGAPRASGATRVRGPRGVPPPSPLRASPGRPRRSPPHCLRRSENFATTSRPGTNK